MKISRAWLQRYFAEPLPEAEQLADALTFHAFEIESVEAHGADSILDVKVTPNRGHDCLSHRGIAKELSAILDRPMLADPLRGSVDLATPTDRVSVEIGEPALCSRYIAGVMTGITVGPSPAWLREALESVGQRSINNVVDATNYVMFDLGQPLHAFDAARLTAHDGTYAIRVRRAAGGESMRALDGKEYAFTDSMLLITDAHADEPIGIAGVKGGAPAGVTEDTATIIIESADFDGVSVRKTAQALRLRTDASSRFEQGISPEVAAFAMRAAADLIRSIAGGTIEGFVDVYPVPASQRVAHVTTGSVNALLGTSFGDADVADVFRRLGLAHVQTGSAFEVRVPHERLDLSIPEDLAEEVARIAGYEHVAAVELPALPAKPELNRALFRTEHLRRFLASRGFSEVLTSVFADSGEHVVLNKADGVRPFLRSSIQPGLADALARNIRLKDLLGVQQVRLFEIGTVWRDGTEEIVTELAVEPMKKQPGAEDFKRELDEYLATLPEDPEAYPDAGPLPDVRYASFSRFPFIVRDVALWSPAGTDAADVLDIIRAHAGDLLVRSECFDRFEKEGRVSYAFRLVFQSPDRTLFDEDANVRMEAVSAALRAAGYEIR